MNYITMKEADIANGEGVRVSLFVSGCSHHCKGCFNQEAWDFNAGKQFDENALQRLSQALNHEYISGLSILGGEPLDPQNANEVYYIVEHVKRMFPQKTIWVYTGYTYDEIKDFRGMELIDVLVDGPFIESKKDISLQFCGSSNQRIIDTKKTRAAKQVVLWRE